MVGMKIRKIYMIAALHGDEPFGLKILAHLRSSGNKQIIAEVGHPEAVAKRKEFLEANLNRSFGPKTPPSKEARIAQYILQEIKTHKPDLIIDLHTCECKVGKSAIIPKLNSDLINIAKRLSMDYVIEGVPSITKRALFGQYPHKSMVIELGRGYRSDVLAALLASKIAALLDNENEDLEKTPITVYSQSRIIKAHEAAGLQLQNYIYNQKLGGYPYLVGKNTYKQYVGFLAKNETRY